MEAAEDGTGANFTSSQIFPADTTSHELSGSDSESAKSVSRSKPQKPGEARESLKLLN